MQAAAKILLLACALKLACCAHDFSNYPFKATLNHADNGSYELYWNFDYEAETISFAVRVQTTGWVGFGLSPNGQMPNSDVVIGWVTDEGQTVFHDRFAEGRDPPTIDEQQDWVLIGGEEENGFTILEFSRDFVTCDNNDLPITAETARVIWSFHATTDPTSEDIPRSLAHTSQGSLSLNLLGGLTDAVSDPSDLEDYNVTVDNIVIPDSDTTYWCAAFKLPESIRNQTRYITKFGPVITEGNEAHVHHLLLYMCDNINDTHLGKGGVCEEGIPEAVAACRGGVIAAAWAVGGETFLYPNNVALPFGGEDLPQYLVMELHYDNPDMKQGTVDNSGVRLWYTSTPREHDAGTITLGHFVSKDHIIPPNTKNFTTTVVMTEDCTRNFIPDEGIHVFGNILHTHVTGHGLTLQHIRYNSDCRVYEELEPIDRNLKYDFNYQQITHLQRDVIIQPGDIVQLKCFYGTEGVKGVTFGGEGTREEMCFSFLYYYPKIDFEYSLAKIEDGELRTYLKSLPSGEQIVSGEDINYSKLDTIDWNQGEVERFQEVVDKSYQQLLCGHKEDAMFKRIKFPEIGCSYIAPGQCAESTPPTCCERISATEDGVTLRVSAALIFSLSLLTTILF